MYVCKYVYIFVSLKKMKGLNGRLKTQVDTFSKSQLEHSEESAVDFLKRQLECDCTECIELSVRGCRYVYTCTHMYVYVYTCKYIYTYAYMYICIYIYLYVYMFIYISIHICT